MTTATEATSPASTAPSSGNSGDGKNTAANVSIAEMERRFAQTDASRRQSAPPAPDTSAQAPATPAAPDSSQPVSTPEAAPAPAEEPQAESTPTPEAEAPADTNEAKADEAEGDVLSPESSLDQKTKERIQRRIDKEVGKRKASDAKVAQLEEKLQQLEARLTQPQDAQPQEQAPAFTDTPAPLPDIKDAKGLAEYKTLAKKTVHWAEEMLDRDDIDEGIVAEGKTYTKADIKAIMRNARMALEDAIPAQLEYFQQQAQRETARTQIVQQARNAFPFLAERDNADVRAAEQFFRTNLPQIVNHPAYEWIKGAYVNGIRPLVAAQQKPKAEPPAKEAPKEAPKPAAPKPKAPSDQAAVSTSGNVPRMNPDRDAQRAIQAEFDRMKSQGNASGSSMAEYLATRDRLKRSGA